MYELIPSLRSLAVLAGALAWAGGASAQVLSWHLDQLYSNQDGTIEFIVVSEYQGKNDQNTLSGAQFASLFSAASHGHASGDVTSFTFPRDLASNQTAGKKFLVASQGFANLG